MIGKEIIVLGLCYNLLGCIGFVSSRQPVTTRCEFFISTSWFCVANFFTVSQNLLYVMSAYPVSDLSYFQELQKCHSKFSKYQQRDRTGHNIVKLDAVSGDSCAGLISLRYISCSIQV